MKRLVIPGALPWRFSIRHCTLPAVLAILLISSLSAQETLIRDATVMTVSHGTYERASILIRDGKIAEIGVDLTTPEDARVIDASDKYVIPGIVDCHSHIASDSINEMASNVTSMTSIEEVLNPSDFNIYREVAGGVTTANIMHGSANPIGGRNAVVKLRWGQDVQGLLFEGAKPGIKLALGENPKRVGSDPPGDRLRRYPASRMGVEDVIRSAFLKAREYQRRWQEWERHPDQQQAIPPRRDLTLEPLVEVLEDDRLVHAHCYRADEILMLLRVAEEFGFTISTFQHVLEGYKVADRIAEHGAGASTFSDWWAYKLEAFDAIPYNAALMVHSGVLVSINSDSAEEARHLNQEAAKTMKYGGLSEDDALALVTLNPARQLQIDDRVGSIEAGKDADLVIYNRYPLSVYAVPEKVFIDGRLYYDRQKDQERQQKIEEEKKELAEGSSSPQGKDAR